MRARAPSVLLVSTLLLVVLALLHVGHGYGHEQHQQLLRGQGPSHVHDSAAAAATGADGIVGGGGGDDLGPTGRAGASRRLTASKCDKCNVPLSQGGCKCDNNCDCRPGLGGGKCDKCNVPVEQGGCKCDNNCDCKPSSSGGSGSDGGSSGGSSGGTSSGGGSSGCPSGWYPAVGTVYDSWPRPGSTECVDYSGCEWAGMFNSIDGGSGPPCKNGARWMDGGDGTYDCRFPESTVKKWNMSATYQADRALLGRKLQVMVQGRPSRTAIVNVRDVCADSDCDGCCRQNTGNKRWKLIDIEKWSASRLLGFNPSAPGFDINDVDVPTAEGLRPGAPEDSVMPLCYKDIGAAAKLP